MVNSILFMLHENAVNLFCLHDKYKQFELFASHA